MRLLLDEMHAPAIAAALAEAGFDIVATAAEPSLRGSPDADLLDHATAAGRALVTENVADYSVLASKPGGRRRAPRRCSSSRTPAGSTAPRSPIPAT